MAQWAGTGVPPVKIERAGKTVRQLKLDVALLRLAFAGVLFMNMFLGFKLLTQEQSVILVPPFQNETIEFINGRANQEFYSQWAWSVSMLAGNLTSGNTRFVKGEFQRIATPGLYNNILEVLDTELASIKRDNATVTFSPRAVIYDPELDRFFVQGMQKLTGPGVQKGLEKQVTFELGFVTKRLRVYLDYYDVYEGKPLTSDIRERELQRQRLQRRLEEQQESL